MNPKLAAFVAKQRAKSEREIALARTKLSAPHVHPTVRLMLEASIASHEKLLRKFASDEAAAK